MNKKELDRMETKLRSKISVLKEQKKILKK